MFRNRKNSQKPADELYAAFKQMFPHVGPGTENTSFSLVSTESTISLTSTSRPQAMDHRHFGDHEGNKEHDTGLGEPDHWRFTPSMLDTNSFAFTSFADQHSQGFTPTMGGHMSGIVHNQAGDLHTPAMGFGLGTPLSISTSDNHTQSTSTIGMQGFHSHLLHSQPFPNSNVFPQQQSFAPSSLMHQNPNLETMHGTYHSLQSENITDMRQPTHFPGYSHGSLESVPVEPVQSMDKFRYQVTLNAPTAMVKHPDEIPITYLNKGQAYAVSINDSLGLGPAQGPIKYRTVIRISFEDEEQRQRPSACWQLWKEGRGLAEAHQRGGKLQAVEYVDQNQNGDQDNRRPRVELEKASFDCFSVIWSPSPVSGTTDCSVAVRFNFLSTDFSHSKGVKGIPVRLCAKTEMLTSSTPDSPPGPSAEVCFCKVKLFRDHGAERKLSNDVAHIKKSIDKLKQQIAQVENGVKETGKRKRSGGDRGGGQRPGKVPKHKRTWSMSSQGSSGRPAVEEDLHIKLASTQDMFTSTRPVSVLYLKGYEQDDPDAYPVALPGEPADLTKIGPLDRKTSWDHKTSSNHTPINSCVVSPSPSSQSTPSDRRLSEPSNVKKLTPLDASQQLPSNDWDQLGPFSSGNYVDFQNTYVKIPKGNLDNPLSDWIEAYEVDPSYEAPPERSNKPIACFYILVKVPTSGPDGCYYKAVYLMKRTLKDLITNIALKCGVDPVQVGRTLRINSKGLKIIVDDEVVRELPEGQDMVVEFTEVETNAILKQEPTSGANTPRASEIPTKNADPKALEMRLLF